MNFKEKYCAYNEEIKPDGVLKEKLQELARKREGRKSSVNTIRKDSVVGNNSSESNRTTRLVQGIFTCLKPIAAVAAICLCLLITMPVLADNLPYVEKLLNLISPELAEQFVPVQMSDESQGIRMEVVAINLQEDEAQVYVTLQDLEGDRLDETTDLYDSYSLHVPFDSVAHCQKLGYDEANRTVTFLVTISAMDGAKEDWLEKVKNQRITFSVREMIGQKTEYDGIEIPIPLAEADLEAEAMSVWINGRSGQIMMQQESPADAQDPRPYIRVLHPDQGDQRFAIEGVEFTGIGYVDGYLHVQYGVPNRLENDNHGHFFLRDAQGNERMYDGAVSFKGTTEETEHISYEDCIFDIAPEELDDYTLYGYFMTSGLHLKGDWQVKFRLGQ